MMVGLDEESLNGSAANSTTSDQNSKSTENKPVESHEP